eukprot:340330_1
MNKYEQIYLQMINIIKPSQSQKQSNIQKIITANDNDDTNTQHINSSENVINNNTNTDIDDALLIAETHLHNDNEKNNNTLNVNSTKITEECDINSNSCYLKSNTKDASTELICAKHSDNYNESKSNNKQNAMRRYIDFLKLQKANKMNHMDNINNKYKDNPFTAHIKRIGNSRKSKNNNNNNKT